MTNVNSLAIITKQNCIGEWLNGRATVSKTVGCVFESRLPCQKTPKGLFCFTISDSNTQLASFSRCVASDAQVFAKQVLHLRYLTNRVSPAKKHRKVFFVLYIIRFGQISPCKARYHPRQRISQKKDLQSQVLFFIKRCDICAFCKATNK